MSDTFLGHETGQHVERKERLLAVGEILRKEKMLERLMLLTPRNVEDNELQMIHSAAYIRDLEKFAAAGGGWWDADTVISPRSVQVARYAVGGVKEALAAVLTGEVDNAVALLRPPGHHAEYDTAMGFCLFNNIALAAESALLEHGLERVAIIDWDVHHGNGTQQAFWQRDDVLYLSCHRSSLFPGTGSTGEVGSGRGEGFTVNVPLPRFSGDMAYYYLFKSIFEPVILDYQPQLILVSAGFDSHFKDPLGGMSLTAAGFAKLAKLVLEWAGACSGGKVVLALEGGYDLEALAASVLLVTGEFAGIKTDHHETGLEQSRELLAPAREAIGLALKSQARFWPVKV